MPRMMTRCSEASLYCCAEKRRKEADFDREIEGDQPNEKVTENEISCVKTICSLYQLVTVTVCIIGIDPLLPMQPAVLAPTVE